MESASASPPAPAEPDLQLRKSRDRLLLRRYARTRDSRLRDHLVARFMPLAHSLANRYRGGSEPIEDLVQIAVVGLLKAIDRFDPAAQTSFASFASPTILGELRHHLRDRGTMVHIGRTARERSRMLKHLSHTLQESLHRSPTAGELARHSGLNYKQIFAANLAAEALHPRSLNQPLRRDESGDTTLVDTLVDVEGGYARVETALHIEAEVTELERRVLELRFEQDLTQTEIGERVGVSQVHVSRTLRRALGKLTSAVSGEQAS